jgi:RNA polymerase sigma factor (sigma-70 family)
MDEHSPLPNSRIPPENRSRLSCSPERLSTLIQRAQSGDVPAQHELQKLLAPKLLATLARFRTYSLIAEDLDGQGYLVLHDLIQRFDRTRGVSFFTFIERMLGASMWSYARAERSLQNHQTSMEGLRRTSSDSDDTGDPEDALWAMLHQERGWLAQRSSVEEAAVIRMTLAAAVDVLPKRQRQVYDLWKGGHTVKEIAARLAIKEDYCCVALSRLRAALREALKELS